jgi:DNA-directed RNA polymerase III subunit RPC2
LLPPPSQECARLNIFTQAGALEYISKKIRSGPRGGDGRPARRSRLEEARELLANVLLAHVPVVDYHFWPKIIFVAQMLRRMISALHDPDCMDDMDYYGNKRLELAGQLLSLLFEDLFKKVRFSMFIFSMYDVQSSPDCMDDMDYYGNKRLELAGQLLSCSSKACSKRWRVWVFFW